MVSADKSPEMASLADALIIGADTVVLSPRGEMLCKPADEAEAYRMLRVLSGHWHEVYTGVAVTDSQKSRQITGCEVTRVKFSDLDNDLIRRYLKTGEPFDKAGAYAIQGFGALLIERIEGCYFNVVGLPLNRLSGMLSTFGFRLL